MPSLLDGIEEVHRQKRDTSWVVLRPEYTFFGGGKREIREVQNCPQNTNSSLPNVIQFHFNPTDAPQLIIKYRQFNSIQSSTAACMVWHGRMQLKSAPFIISQCTMERRDNFESVCTKEHHLFTPRLKTSGVQMIFTQKLLVNSTSHSK